MKLALFDFDGTITHKDSLEDFTRFAVGTFRYYIGLAVLSPFLVLYLLGVIKNSYAKRLFLTHFFKGWNAEKYHAIAKDYSLNQIDKILRGKAKEKLGWHRQQGHQIVIVSASIEGWLKPWCDANGFDLLATSLEIRNGKLTGRYAGKNCYGQEKVYRIKSEYRLEDYDHIFAYGDTGGDLPMMSLANESFYREFE